MNAVGWEYRRYTTEKNNEVPAKGTDWTKGRNHRSGKASLRAGCVRVLRVRERVGGV